MDDVLVNKAATIERCIKRIKEEYKGSELEFEENYTKQDSIILNLERASQACIDMGTRVIRMKKLGVPQSSRDVFIILEKSGIINAELGQKLQKMVGFRNIAVHDYQDLNLDIIAAMLYADLEQGVATPCSFLIDSLRKFYFNPKPRFPAYF